MPRGYRRVILAAFAGLILAAAPVPKNRTQTDQSKATNNIERSLATIANAQAKQAEPGEYQAPCREGEYKNNSDLCAQWYAALSAGDAAFWTKWTFWLSVGSLGASAIGLIALLITIRQGREANRISRQQFESGFKPWLSLSAADELILLEREKLQKDSMGPVVLKASLTVRNIVDMPATITAIRCGFQSGGFGKMDQMFLVLGKGESHTFAASGCMAIQEWDRDRYMQHPPALIGSIYYLDPLGKVREYGFAFAPNKLWLEKLERWGGAQYNFDREVSPEGRNIAKKFKHALSLLWERHKQRRNRKRYIRQANARQT